MNDLYGSTSTTAAVPIEKVPTGVPGLDEVLCGGLPKACPSLIFGGPGTGKTLLGFSFVMACCARGEAAVFASFDQGADEVRRHARTLGFDLEAQEEAGLSVVIGEPLPPDADIDPERTMSKMYDTIAAACERIEARHIVLNGLDLFTELLECPSKQRAELRFIRRWAIERRMTVLATAKNEFDQRSPGSFNDFLNFGVDCSIRLFQAFQGHARVRKLEVIKYRGSAFRPGQHALHLGEQGLALAPLPEIAANEMPEPPSFVSGNDAFDAILGGGLLRASSNVFVGSTGSGKSVFLSMISDAAFRRGERVLRLNLETPTEYKRGIAGGAGVIGGEEIRDLYKLMTVLPESVDAEELLFDVLGIMQQFKPDLLVLDSLSACRRFGDEQTAQAFLMRLIGEAKKCGITMIFSHLAAPGDVNFVLNGKNLTPMFAIIVRLDIVQTGGGFERQLVVVKRGGADHSRRIHAFEIRDDGIELVAPRQPEPQARWRVST